jgi:putative ABC transport system permease protein
VSVLPPDLRHALRSLRRRPLLFAVAASALALGIGASTAIFSVVDAVLLRPLPFAEPERLVMLWQSIPEASAPFVEVSYPYLLEARARSRLMASLAAMPSINSGFILGGAEPARVEGRIVTGNFFDVLVARAAQGRTFTQDEDRVGMPRVVVVSHGLWQRQFGGDPRLVGRTLVVDGTSMTVIGVMPPGFRYPSGAELWTPLVPVVPEIVDKPNVGWAVVVGRLAPGATLAQARAELDGIVAAQLKIHYPKSPAVKHVLTPLAHDWFGASRPALLVLLGAVLLVLLLACANVSALLLARAAARQREIAVRLALGASRGRLVRQLLAEASLIALAGGVAGTLLAVWGLDALIALVPAEVPRLQDAAIDPRVLAFALALTALSALGAGLVPALVASKASLTEVLAEGGRSVGPGAGQARARAVLVGAEAAIALVLLAGAGLLTRTFQNLRHVDLGFDPRNVLTLEVAGPRGKYDKVEERRQLYRALLERIDALPGVEASAAVLIRPLWGQVGLDWHFVVEGQSEVEAERNPSLNLQIVTPGFFRTMRMPVRRGRTFTERDTPGVPPVVVVSEVLARRYWPGQDPIGKRVKVPMPSPPYAPTWMTVVGVVGEARYRELQAARLDFYMTYLQSDEGLKHLVVRTAGDPMALAPAVRAAVRSVDRDLILTDVTSMAGLVDTALGGARFGMQLLSGFALVALLLAALGIYGVVAFVVSRRTREVGIRMALGARAADVLALVLRQGMAPVLAGLVVGMAGALALGRLSAGLLFGVPPHDPATLAAAAAVLGLAALLACALPARRAARIDPAQALRDE